MIFMISAFVLTGCGGLKDNPPTSAAVYSNGGMAVVKGEYLYYVNGYVNEDDLTDAKTENVEGKVVKGAIYRTKLVNGTVQKDKDGFVKDASGKSLTERVVSKIVGFSNGGFYIIDDYIYYATPCMTYSSSSSKLQNDLVEFHRIKIDGTDDKLIYTTKETSDDLQWNVTKIGGKVYITSYTGKSLAVANATDKKLLATITDVTSCAIPKTEEYIKNSYDDTATINRFIYYTRNVVDSDNQSSNYKGNVICRMKVSTGNTEVLKYDTETKYSFVSAKNNALYFTKSNTVLGDTSRLYKNKLNGDSFTSSTETELTVLNSSSYAILDYEYNIDPATGHKTTPVSDSINYVVALGSDGKLRRYTSIDGANEITTEILYTATTSTSILDIDGSNLYVAESNKIYVINAKSDLSQGEATRTLVSSEDYTYLVTNHHFFDITDNFLFTYRGFELSGDANETNYYLSFIDGDYTVRFVGEFESDELPAEPEQLEGYDPSNPDSDIEYIPWID